MMSQVVQMPLSDLSRTLELARRGDMPGARAAIGVPPGVATDGEVFFALTELEKGRDLFNAGRHSEAVDHLEKALVTIKKSTDTNTVFTVNTLVGLAQGIKMLHEGNVHGAIARLEGSTKDLELLGSVYGGLERTVLDYKASTYVALARKCFSSGDLTLAEQYFGKARDQHNQLLRLLNPEDPDEISSYSVVYATRLEMVNTMAWHDLMSLSYEEATQRLASASGDAEELEKTLGSVPLGPIKDVEGVTLIAYKVLVDICTIEQAVIRDRSCLDGTNLKKLESTRRRLHEAKILAENAGERGKGLLYLIGQLGIRTKNLLQVGSLVRRDFGRWGGLVSSGVFVIYILVVSLFLKPAPSALMWYVMAGLVVALVAGFGLSAVKFAPLLSSLFRNKDGMS